MGVPVWNKVKSFLLHFGGRANFEYGHINSGTAWWLCQFGKASHISWHSLVGVPIWNRSNDFWYILLDVPILNTVTLFLAQFGECVNLE